jgi:hypothetical protein
MFQTSRMCPTHEAQMWRATAKLQSARIKALSLSLEIAEARVSELEEQVYGLTGLAMAAIRTRVA